MIASTTYTDNTFTFQPDWIMVPNTTRTDPLIPWYNQLPQITIPNTVIVPDKANVREIGSVLPPIQSYSGMGVRLMAYEDEGDEPQTVGAVQKVGFQTRFYPEKVTHGHMVVVIMEDIEKFLESIDGKIVFMKAVNEYGGAAIVMPECRIYVKSYRSNVGVDDIAIETTIEFSTKRC